ncbi:allophanate hydrolase subunit 1 [Paracoccus bogoriensis]|uniref:5-oxoprolinase subunit B family protein n=1 Tax=Paracoccus bogoriensis TaxID=242065 RepID=UPI001C6676D4|nr:carboxyltransferase domain-containing protein [Paracoccus bogoriensis]MBW7055988.1 allophanate hydrolase subunit 1 [Paracoccus bogoriensis]
MTNNLRAPLSPEILPHGLDGLLVRFSLSPDPQAMAAARRLAADLSERPPAGAVEIAPALVSCLLRFDPARITPRLEADLLARARAALADAAPPKPRRRWTLPTAFGGAEGPELAPIARQLGLTPQQAVAQICDTDLAVLAIGFAPGQPYLGLLPEGWNLPRLPELVPEVPAGAVVVALRQIVIFGNPSPTGWRQVGRMAFRSFWPDRASPMPLAPGDAIRLAPAPADRIAALRAEPDGMGGAVCETLP